MSWHTKLGIALVAFILPIPALALADEALPNPQPLRSAPVAQAPPSSRIFDSTTPSSDIDTHVPAQPAYEVPTAARPAATTTSTYSASSHTSVSVGIGVGVGGAYGSGYYSTPPAYAPGPAYYAAPAYYAPAPYYYPSVGFFFGYGGYGGCFSHGCYSHGCYSHGGGHSHH